MRVGTYIASFTCRAGISSYVFFKIVSVSRIIAPFLLFLVGYKEDALSARIGVIHGLSLSTFGFVPRAMALPLEFRRWLSFSQGPLSAQSSSGQAFLAVQSFSSLLYQIV